MLKNPLVSIIVPSFQQAVFLRQAIDSILAQDYRPIEVLVLDGGSTDGSREILESYGARIWFRSQPDGGQSQAINEGFRRSRGEIVAWLNSDDFYYPGAVAHAVTALQSNPKAALVYGDGNLVAQDGSVMLRFPDTVPFDLWRLANLTDYILQPTVFFRREALFSVGLLDEQLNWALDWELWLRLARRYPFAYTERVLAANRIHLETKTKTGGFRRIREIAGILRRHGVPWHSPAVVSYTIITVVRRFCHNEELITPEIMVASVPGPLQRLAAPVIAAVERCLRRWLQNVQGIWKDGFAGRRGRLWLPSDGEGGYLQVRGRNLDIAGQRITLCVAGRKVATGALGGGETFTLELGVAAGSIPVRAELRCARTVEVGVLDSRLGPRRAGCLLEVVELVSRLN
jgi:GT2 family glycosyltransferase